MVFLMRLVFELSDAHRAQLSAFESGTYNTHGGSVCVLVNDAIVLGLLRYDVLSPTTTVWLKWICCTHGYGTHAMALFTDWCRCIGGGSVAQIRLLCTADESDADDAVLRRFNFYAKCGFRAVAVHYSESPIGAAFIMEKRL